jgi:hypothetical protein
LLSASEYPKYPIYIKKYKMKWKIFQKAENTKSIRVRVDAGNEKERYVSVKLDNSFDTLEFLSLKLSSSDVYRLYDGDYGVIAGRVLGNEGIGLPNCRVSVFIPRDTESKGTTDSLDAMMVELSDALYPFENVTDENSDGIRYNLLPHLPRNRGFNGFPVNEFGIGVTPKTPVGTMVDREEMVCNPVHLEVYKKFYKFSTVTNESGDYMLFGVPVGDHTLHMDCDLTDIGRWSLTPSLMSQVYGYPETLFMEGGTRIEPSTDLSALPHIQSQNATVTVKPLWTQMKGEREVGLSRKDFKVPGDILPSFTMFMNGITHADETYIGDHILFRLIISTVYAFHISLPVGVEFYRWGIRVKTRKIYFNKPSFRESQFFVDDEHQVCGGLYDLGPIGFKLDYKPVTFVDPRDPEAPASESMWEDGGGVSTTASIPDYVIAFNNHIKNNVAINTTSDILVDESETIQLNSILAGSFPGTALYRDSINSIRASYGRPALTSSFIYYTANDLYSDQTNIHQLLSGYDASIPTSKVVNDPDEPSYEGYEPDTHDPASKIPDSWTNKLDLETFRGGTIDLDLFSYKAHLTQTDIANGLVNVEQDVDMVNRSSYVKLNDESGMLSLQVPCNRRRMITSEDGRLVDSDNPTKGVFTEFSGYMIFSMNNPIHNPPSRRRTDRVRIKVPQSTPSHINDTLNLSWVKESHTFQAGKIYSVAQKITSRPNTNFEDRIGIISNPGEVTGKREGYEVRMGMNYSEIYVNRGYNITVFKDEWLNLNLFFPQYLYKTKRKSSSNLASDFLIASKKTQLKDNSDVLGGKGRNSKSMLHGGNFPTKFVEVNPNDFVWFYAKLDTGFHSLNTQITAESIDNYASSNESDKKYFYKGFFNDSTRYLVKKDVI